MIREVLLMVTIAGAAGVPGVARAGPERDPLRCEAAGLRQEARYHSCMGRCERRAQRFREGRFPACEGSCEARFDAAMNRLRSRPVCAGVTDEADPSKCNVELLRATARQLVCLSHCDDRAQSRPSFDAEACQRRCDERFNAAKDEIMDSAMCVGLVARGE
jgi:hypothetical protein